MRWLRRPFRKIFSLLLMAVVTVAILLAMFRFGAFYRESQTPEQAAGATFVRVADLKMHYRAWGPETGRVILLVHGTMAWGETFRDIAAPLAAQGFRVIAPDLPPFGFSERPAGHDYSRAAQAKRILAFADALRLDRFVLGVHSYGGGAAIEAAFEAPERIEGLILLDVAMGLGQTADGPPYSWLLSNEGVRETIVASTFTNPLMTGIGLKLFMEDDALVTRERIDLYRQPFVMNGATGAIGRWLFTGLYRNESGAASSDPARYRAFQPPVLVVWGRQDSVTPLAQGEEIAGLFPNAKLEVLDGVNHIPHVEKPADVVRLIATFMRSMPAPVPDPAEDPAVDADKDDRLPQQPGATEPPADGADTAPPPSP